MAGKLEEFVAEWRAAVLPLREAFGFTFHGAWSLPETDEFVFVVSHDGDFDEANRGYYDSEERKELTPNPARHIAESLTSVADVVL